MENVNLVEGILRKISKSCNGNEWEGNFYYGFTDSRCWIGVDNLIKVNENEIIINDRVQNDPSLPSFKIFENLRLKIIKEFEKNNINFKIENINSFIDIKEFKKLNNLGINDKINVRNFKVI
jgi:hypothetical protein